MQDVCKNEDVRLRRHQRLAAVVEAYEEFNECACVSNVDIHLHFTRIIALKFIMVFYAGYVSSLSY